MTDAQKLEEYLHAHIPLTVALGISVLEASEARVRLAAPLEPNVNHRGTAFGGSLVSVAIAAAWGVVWTRLRAGGRSARIVIQRSQMEYLLPASGDFEAVAELADDAAWVSLITSLARRGRGRVTIRAVILCDHRAVATFEGVFVALADDPAIPA